MMKRTISLLLIFVVALGLFAGCGKSEDSSAAASTESTADGGSISTADVTFFDADGDALYRIVKPESQEAAATVAAVLFKGIKDKLGISCKNTIDTNEDGTDAYEILVGNTNRPESVQAIEYLESVTGARYKDYVICTIGKKIVINSRDDETLATAVQYFLDNFVKSEGVAGGINYTYAVEGNFKDITVAGNSIGKYSFVRPYYNSSYITQMEMEKIVDSVYTGTGYMLSIKDDDKTTAGEYEIIVGNSSREGVTAITNYDEYSIKVNGNKVYINGGSPYATALAVTEFGKMLETGAVTEANNVDGSYAAASASYDKSTYFYPTWKDDFDYVEGGKNGIDTSKWHIMVPGENDANGHNGRTSVRSDRADVTYVKDGKFYISATYDDNYYYGAKLVTRDHMIYRYGYIEMSALMPHGDAFWVSLWMNSKEWDEGVAYFTEINVTEMFGNSASAAANCHGWKISSREELYEEIWEPQGYPTHWSLDGKYSSQKRYYCPDGVFNDTFHTFGYYWTEDECTFVCDGNVYFSVDLNEDPVYKNTLTQPLYLILSEAVCFATGSGKNMPDDAKEWQESNDFIVDYIHIYQLDDGKHEMRLLK